ncbi:MAG: PEP-CTERM/exosortase system-associated acyltransferase [Rhodobacterales bacterium]|nr:PEP-CTERM/exosortase system-associated acyltransferase [Rhodobacterales bacterium]
MSEQGTTTEPMAGPAPNASLRDLYETYFEAIPADTADLKREVFRLRYQVLCVEHGYFTPDELPDQMEQDHHDDHSAHCLLIHKPTGNLAGTVRLVLPKEPAPGHGLPIQEYCRDPLIQDAAAFPVLQMGEISRLSVSKQFRRRVTDTEYPDALDDNIGQPRREGEIRRLMPHITLGLMQGVLRMCVENNLPYVCASMEAQLLRLLARVGIRFDNIGPPVELFGLRQPCYRKGTELLDEVRREHPDVWDVLTVGGTYAAALEALSGSH